jgi:hypothetical protein
MPAIFHLIEFGKSIQVMLLKVILFCQPIGESIERTLPSEVFVISLRAVGLRELTDEGTQRHRSMGVQVYLDG